MPVKVEHLLLHSTDRLLPECVSGHLPAPHMLLYAFSLGSSLCFVLRLFSSVQGVGPGKHAEELGRGESDRRDQGHRGRGARLGVNRGRGIR